MLPYNRGTIYYYLKEKNKLPYHTLKAFTRKGVQLVINSTAFILFSHCFSESKPLQLLKTLLITY